MNKEEAVSQSSLFEVRKAIARHLDTAPERVRPQHGLRRELHLDRIDLAMLAMQLEEQFAIELPFYTIEKMATVAELGAWIDTLVVNGRA